MAKIRVSIMMGSESDMPVMEGAAKVLEEFGVDYEVAIASAHRSPDWTLRYIREAEKRGTGVFIAGAGGAAHLDGTVAAHTVKPVIGVPIDSSSLNGLDSLLSTVQMPAGVPVATVAIGKAGAYNAGVLAAQMLALSNKSLVARLTAHKEKLAKSVDEKSKKLREKA